MSKTIKAAERVMDIPMGEKEAVSIAGQISAGAVTLVKKEVASSVKDAADILDAQIKRLDANQAALCRAEIEMAKYAKAMISKCKDLAGQLGDAMARIDKVVVKDFDSKLSQLERFVSAMQSLDELKKNGRLDAMIDAFAKK